MVRLTLSWLSALLVASTPSCFVAGLRTAAPPKMLEPFATSASGSVGKVIFGGSAARSMKQVATIWKQTPTSLRRISYTATAGDGLVYLSRCIYHTRNQYPLAAFGENFAFLAQSVITIGLLHAFGSTAGLMRPWLNKSGSWGSSLTQRRRAILCPVGGATTKRPGERSSCWRQEQRPSLSQRTPSRGCRARRVESSWRGAEQRPGRGAECRGQACTPHDESVQCDGSIQRWLRARARRERYT